MYGQNYGQQRGYPPQPQQPQMAQGGPGRPSNAALLSQQLQAAAAVAAAVSQGNPQNGQNNGQGSANGGGGGNSAVGGAGGNKQRAVSGGTPSPQVADGKLVGAEGGKALNDEKVYSWINELAYGPNKEQAFLELGKKREYYDDLALVLWNSFGVMTALLEEIVAVYPLLSPPNLTTPASNRVCNALALLQCVASHADTRTAFLHAQIPLFLYPFLNTSSKQRPFEYLRLTSLGVIGALVKNDTPEVIQFLLTTEIIPLCLKIMESSSELSKTVAIFIVQKILMDDQGLSYVCQTYDRFEAVSNVLKLMIEQLSANPTARLLRHVIRCYLRLADNPDARVALAERLPQQLRDDTFEAILRDDPASKQSLQQLLQALQ